MKKINRTKMIIKTTILVCMMELMTLQTHADGVNEAEWWNWFNSYLATATRIMYGIIPLALVIYLLLKAVDWFKKDAQGEQVPSYWSTVSKGVTVAIVAVSINTILKIVSIVTE